MQKQINIGHMKELLKTVVLDQQTTGWSDGLVVRDFPDTLLHSPEIVVISGIRRCGKSTLLQQIRAGMQEKHYFMNFDDERLIHFKTEDFQLLHELFMEFFGKQSTFYFDEIQNVPGWERFVRRLHDEGNKVFVTGSNASMLSRELGTRLTGRHITFHLYPFSFSEYMKFRHETVSRESLYTTTGRSVLQKRFSEFLHLGGFPGFLKGNNSDTLKSLYQSIIYRDVMVRNRLTAEKEILELVWYLAGNLTRPSSNNSLAKRVGIKNATTIKNYLSFLEDTYLLFQLKVFDYSASRQLHHPRKHYFIDNGLVRSVGFMFSEESGRLLENLVFLELKRRGHELYYHHGKKECDFLVREGNHVTQAIQVSYTLEAPETRTRELSGLHEAMATHKLKEGLILTNYMEETIKTAEGTIQIEPVWKWMIKGLADA